MGPIVRVIGVSLLTAGLGAWLGLALGGGNSDAKGIAFVLGCVGAIVGALAGTAGETVAALRHQPSEREKGTGVVS